MAHEPTMTKKKLSEVQDSNVTMAFESNPNIPTTTYSEETYNAIKEKIKKTLKAQKIKAIIDSELKPEDKSLEDESLGIKFSFSSM